MNLAILSIKVATEGEKVTSGTGSIYSDNSGTSRARSFRGQRFPVTLGRFLTRNRQMHPFYMKTYRFIGLFIGLLAGAGGGFVPKAMAQVELVPNSIQGTVRFSNVNPDILALLNPPGNEGMSYLYMYASSLPAASESTAIS